MVRIVVVLCLLFSAAVCSGAEAPGKQQVAEELAQAMKADEAPARQRLAEELLAALKTAQALAEVMQQAIEMERRLVQEMNLPPGAEGPAKKYLAAVTALLQKEFAWENNRKAYAELYAETFTEQELKGLLDFFRSPLGRKYAENAPFLAEASVEMSMELIRRLQPELDRMTEELEKEVAAGGKSP